jgi:hypothetical protein
MTKGCVSEELCLPDKIRGQFRSFQYLNSELHAVKTNLSNMYVHYWQRHQNHLMWIEDLISISDMSTGFVGISSHLDKLKQFRMTPNVSQPP